MISKCATTFRRKSPNYGESVSTENIDEISDIAGFRREFNNLFGFDVDGVNYEVATETEILL